MTKHFFSGATTALVTPFKNGDVDYNSLKRLVKYQLDAGIQGFVVSGSTGEAATLTRDEKTKVLAFVLSEVANAVPVIFGAGTFNTAETCALVEYADKLGPNGYLIVTPYYNKPPQRGLIAHFIKVAEKTTRPIVLYNVPGRTAVTMSVETVVELSKTSNIAGIKEAAGKVSVMEDLVKQCPPSFSILSGDDETFIQALRKGSHGVISVVSHIVPKICVAACRSPQGVGEKEESLVEKASMHMFCESNPIPVKWALKQMGIIDSSEVRLPLVGLNPSYHSTIKGFLNEI